jgi:hypothetical protein
MFIKCWSFPFNNQLNKKAISLLFLLMACFVVAFSQFRDDFSDRNLANRWQGNIEKFVVNNNERLQLNDASATSPARLATLVPILSSTTWEFWLTMDFAPSATNYANIILSSNKADFSQGFNGYWLKMGGISGDQDAIEFYRQDGTRRTLIFSGTAGAVANAPVIARVRITRDAQGLWTLSVDYDGDRNFVEEAMGMDNIYNTGSFFGLECIYTTTRSDKFLFDDFVIDTQKDDIPPQFLAVNPLNNSTLELFFDEPIELNTNVSDFQIEPNRTINQIRLGNANSLILEVTPDFINLETYTITVANIRDVAGNSLVRDSLTFEFLQFESPEPYDLLITEIMADPSPTVGLPDVEYVELYNRSKKVFNLKGFLFSNPRKEVSLSDYVLLPGQFVVIYKGDQNLFANNNLGLSDFPVLVNGGDDLALLAPNGTIIHTVSYTINWYKNNRKRDGGWSLEMINPDDFCNVDGANWQASQNGNGGTPGNRNAVWNVVPDRTFNGVVRALLVDATKVRLFFDEAVDPSAVADLNNYAIEGISLKSALAEPLLFNTVIIEFGNNIPANKIFRINLGSNITDCQGNLIENNNFVEFAIPDIAAPMDVIINEVLFNPETGGSDFVELYNRSNKILDVGQFIMANRQGAFIAEVKPVRTGYLLFPQSYVVITPSVEDIRSRYNVENVQAFIASDLPSYPDKEGTVVVYQAGAQEEVILDEFSYNRDFHHPLLDDENGVSLERINPERPTQDRNNWHSAAASVGFATPTYQNSQFLNTNENIKALFTLPYSTVSPDGDGFQDFLLLNYQLDEVGFIADTRIYDANGRLVKRLSRGELLATQGSIKWDGTLDDGKKARIGIYIVQVEYFQADGRTGFFQKEFVVAGRLD